MPSRPSRSRPVIVQSDPYADQNPRSSYSSFSTQSSSSSSSSGNPTGQYYYSDMSPQQQQLRVANGSETDAEAKYREWLEEQARAQAQQMAYEQWYRTNYPTGYPDAQRAARGGPEYDAYGMTAVRRQTQNGEVVTINYGAQTAREDWVKRTNKYR